MSSLIESLDGEVVELKVFALENGWSVRKARAWLRKYNVPITNMDPFFLNAHLASKRLQEDTNSPPLTLDEKKEVYLQLKIKLEKLTLELEQEIVY